MSDTANAQDLKPVDIKDLRRRLGGKDGPISQAKLAQEYLGGINQATVSRMEENPTKQKGPVAVLLRELDAKTPDFEQDAA